MFPQYASEYVKAESDYRAERIRRATKGRRRARAEDHSLVYRFGRHAR